MRDASWRIVERVLYVIAALAFLQFYVELERIYYVAQNNYPNVDTRMCWGE